MSRASVPEVNILGIRVGAIDLTEALDVIDGWIERGEREYVTVTGAHGVIESQSDPELRDIHNRAGLVAPDGMPLVWFGRLRGARGIRRVYGPDLMLAVMERSAQKGYRHFFYGGAEGVPERLAEGLRARFPGLGVAGVLSPPFRPLTPAEDAAVVETINATRPDIVWIGLSTPKQERWMAAHLDRIPAPVMIGVGAAFDFHCGLKPQAPVWMRRSGLEWTFRLATEPRRLWRRYARIVPGFLVLALAQMLGIRDYPI